MKSLLKKTAIGIGIAAFWILLWYTVTAIINNPLIFPNPRETLIRLCELTTTKSFWIFTAKSLFRIITGIIIAIPAAVIISVICTHSRIFKHFFEPAVLLMKTTPVVSFILIAIFIFDREIIPSVITFVMIFPVLYRNLCEGIKQTPNNLLEMARLFRIPWHLKIKNIYLPSTMPYFCSALTTSVGLAIKAGIAAEVVAYIPDSIGKKLSDAKSYMEPADLLAWTAVIIIMSLILEKLISLLLSLIGRRKRNAQN